MELWIRSQDRNKMVKIDGLYIDLPQDFNSGGFGVYTNSELTREGILRLGKYKTKERALEVLDEIEKHLRNLHSIRLGTDYLTLDEFNVYNMPKE